MNKFTNEPHVIPRPVENLPEYANARSRHSLAARLVDAFRLSDVSASAIANAVVNPTDVRKSIGEPTAPEAEKIPVPGGTLLGVRTSVWARRIMPDPRNPRTLPSRRHPFAIEPGTGGEDCKFRPVPEARPFNSEEPNRGELVVDVESRHHLTWASQQAAGYVLAENDWRRSIASQGVMEAVWVVATTYQHEDGSAAATALTTAEGSSRTTCVHDLLQIRSSDVPYDDNESKLRAHIRKLNKIHERGPDESESIALRCERIPALILVGFLAHPQSAAQFPTAVKSLVALRHVDPPKPWGDGPEYESLADEVLAELYRRDLISSTEYAYFAGSCTQAEAKAAHLPDDPVLRAARIVHLFTNHDERVDYAIRVAVTSQSTRKRITSKLMHDLATVLILRAVADDPSKVDQIRRYLRHSFGKFVRVRDWEPTGRSNAQLLQDALTEVQTWIGTHETEDPGPSSVELAVRASYPLVVSGRLNADRGSAGNEQPDRRTPGEVLDAMRRNPQGIHQLGQAVQDFDDEQPIRAVDENGNVKSLSDGSGDQTISDIYLRNTFPPPGKARKAQDPGDTPLDRYISAQNNFDGAIENLREAFDALLAIRGDDDRPIADVRGAEPELVGRWRDELKRMDEEMIIWVRTYRQTYGTKSARNGNAVDDEAAADTDPYEVDEQDSDSWSEELDDETAPV